VPLFRLEAINEELKDLVTSRDRWLTRFVNEVRSDNTMWACYHLLKEGRQ
jgi:hypothetical protein